MKPAVAFEVHSDLADREHSTDTNTAWSCLFHEQSLLIPILLRSLEVFLLEWAGRIDLRACFFLGWRILGDVDPHLV